MRQFVLRPTTPIANRDGTPTRDLFRMLLELFERQETFTNTEKNTDPIDPPEGSFVMWMSDGTDTGGDGDILVKITAGGVTKTATLVDFSAI